MNEVEIVIEFKKHLIAFLDELIVQLPNEPDLLIARIFVKDKIPIIDIINHIIQYILEYKDKIKERDDSFMFTSDSPLQHLLSIEKLTHYRKIWRSKALDEDDKLIIWKWIDGMIFLTEKYQKSKN